MKDVVKGRTGLQDMRNAHRILAGRLKEGDRLCGLVATDPGVRVQFPALPDFLKSSGSGTGSTQPRKYN
jgi:hypothetical protein